MSFTYKELKRGNVIQLGGEVVEVLFTTSYDHSITFLDEENARSSARVHWNSKFDILESVGKHEKARLDSIKQKKAEEASKKPNIETSVKFLALAFAMDNLDPSFKQGSAYWYNFCSSPAYKFELKSNLSPYSVVFNIITNRDFTTERYFLELHYEEGETSWYKPLEVATDGEFDPVKLKAGWGYLKLLGEGF